MSLPSGHLRRARLSSQRQHEVLDFQANLRHCPGVPLIDALLAFSVLSFYLRPLWNEGVKRGRNGKAVLCFMVFFGPGNVVAMAHFREEES